MYLLQLDCDRSGLDSGIFFTKSGRTYCKWNCDIIVRTSAVYRLFCPNLSQYPKKVTTDTFIFVRSEPGTPCTSRTENLMEERSKMSAP